MISEQYQAYRTPHENLPVAEGNGLNLQNKFNFKVAIKKRAPNLGCSLQ